MCKIQIVSRQLLAIVVLSFGAGSAYAQGTWHVLAPGSFSYAQAPVVVGGKVYAFGGFVDYSVRRYDPGTNQWDTVAGLQTNVIQYFGVTVFENKVWMVGGDTGGSGWRNYLQVFDPASNTWSFRAPMPQGARYGLSAAVLNGKIYAVGGTDGSSYLSRVEIYDPATNAWSDGVSMPSPRGNPWIGAINGKLYVAGGGNATGPLNSTIAFDPTTNSWSSKANKPTAGGSDAFNVVVDGKLWVLNVNVLEVYDPSTDTWATNPGPPTARGAIGVAGDNVLRRIYTLGGWSGVLHDNFEAFVLAQNVECSLSSLASHVASLSLSQFVAPNDSARAGRRKAMSNKLTSAANQVESGNPIGAINELTSLLQKLDGEPLPPDWMVDGSERDALWDCIQHIIVLLEAP